MPVGQKSEAAKHPQVVDPTDSLAVDPPERGEVRLRTYGPFPGDFIVLGPEVEPSAADELAGPVPGRTEWRVTPEGSDFAAVDADLILEAARLNGALVEKVSA